MTSRKQFALGISGTVIAGIIGFLLLLWWGHFEATAQTARSQAETEEIQGRIVDAVEKLTNLHEDENVAKQNTISLCKAGDISKCSTCKAVGVYDAPACEK